MESLLIVAGSILATLCMLSPLLLLWFGQYLPKGCWLRPVPWWEDEAPPKSASHPQPTEAAAEPVWEASRPSRPVDVADPNVSWSWPLEFPASSHAGKPLFENEFSGLRLCGYRVGKTKGLPESERRLLLHAFFSQVLPTEVRTYFGDAYGHPGSQERLQKMASVISQNCRNFKANDPHRYSRAIREWECDLEWLRQRYWSGEFRWPNS